MTGQRWTGGNTIQLIQKIHSIVLKSKNNYKTILDELHSTFSTDLDKTKIIQEGQLKLEEITLTFKSKRSQANKQITKKLSIFEIAQDRRIKKLEYLRALDVLDNVPITRIQYIDELNNVVSGGFTTPIKKSPFRLEKEDSSKIERQEIIAELSIPFMDDTCLSEVDKMEAETIQQNIETNQIEEETNSNVSIEAENKVGKGIFEIAFRAILCEHEQRNDLYRTNGGSGEIIWNIYIRDTSVDNTVLQENEYNMRTMLSCDPNTSQMQTKTMITYFKNELIKYEWYVRTYLSEAKATNSIKMIEDVIGQIIKRKIISSTDPTHRIF